MIVTESRSYAEHYPDATFDVILVDGRPAGRLYVARRTGGIRVVDVSLLPGFRGRGVGTTVLRRLLDESADTGKPVSLHVERSNPALRLYQRLGFRVVADEGVHLLLRWDPG